jgi:predicted alpha/beta superfamily hydrolase/imidazolonepropionase-like amidohydrolase
MRTLLALLLSGAAWAQPVALVNATIHPGGGQPAVQTNLILEKQTIVGISQDVPAGAQVVNLSGQHLYPGLVESDSVLGLSEIDSVRGGNDYREITDNNADLQAEISLNPDSELLPVARSGGILTAALQPVGGRFAGQVAVMSLWGWTPEDMRLIPSPGVVLNWPRWEKKEDEKARKAWKLHLAEIEDRLEEARAYARLPEGQRPVRPDLAALAGRRLFIHAETRFQIETALEFCKRLKIEWVLVGGAEAASLIPQLAAEKVDVIYTEMYRLPYLDYQDEDLYYRTPALLRAGGLRVALAGPQSHDNARWLRDMAGAAWAHGWSEAEAIDSITSVPCEILGLKDQGRLAVGQRATLICCNGPLLDGRSQIVRAWVGGEEIPLDDRQKQLYRRYRNKPRLNSPGPKADNKAMIRSVGQTPIRKRPEGPSAWGWSMTGDIRYHEVDNRQVWVYLPPSYKDSPEKDYPVLYAMDGQNVFEKGTAFQGQEWHMDEAAQRAMAQGKMREAIIVAVSNGGPKRIEEYSPKADPEYGGGGAEKFAQFLTKDLKPQIDETYRTQAGPENTGVLGSSMGGLFSLYMGLAHANTFGLVGAISPSLWFAEKDMIAQWKDHPPAQRPSKVWLDMGDKESPSDQDKNGVPDTLDNTRALRDVLASQNQQGLMYHEIAGATHSEGSWSERIQDVLQGLLPPA